MNAQQLLSLIKDTDLYNLHSHTQYCDGHATVREMANAAADAGFKVWGVSPHSPICVPSVCNMHKEDVPAYLDDVDEMKEALEGRTTVLAAMEVDYISPDFGPHIDYFHELPLDYRIGSVHYVPNQEGVPLDCDGDVEHFTAQLHEEFRGDLRYVVEKYFEQVLRMIEAGGFEVLGHFDKIAGNAWANDPEIESQGWYQALIDDVISHAQGAGCLVEINTKALSSRNRFYPARSIWPRLTELPVIVNSDAHYPDKVNAGRPEALRLLRDINRKS